MRSPQPQTHQITTSTHRSKTTSQSVTPLTYNPPPQINIPRRQPPTSDHGQTLATKAGSFFELCKSSNVNNAILIFVYDFFGQGPENYPQLSFRPTCAGPNTAQSDLAPGLANCTDCGTRNSTCPKKKSAKKSSSVWAALSPTPPSPPRAKPRTCPTRS